VREHLGAGGREGDALAWVRQLILDADRELERMAGVRRSRRLPDALRHRPQREGSGRFDEVASRSYLLSHARRRVEGPQEQIERVRQAGSVRRDGPGHGS